MSKTDYANDSTTEAEEMEHFAISPMAWVHDHQPVLVPTSASCQLSAFERLPLELRQQIYGYLGFPVANRTWVDSNYPFDTWNCKDTSLDSETRVKLLEMGFGLPASARQKWSMNNEVLYTYPKFEKSLLGLCRTTRTDVLNLLYHKTPVVLDRNFNVPKITHACTYLSHITILRMEYPSWALNYPNSRNRMLIEQIETLRLFAEYCVSLRELHFHPFLPGVPVTYSNGTYFYDTTMDQQLSATKRKHSVLQSLALGIGLLARKCSALEKIEIPHAVCSHFIRPNGRVLTNDERIREDPTSWWGFPLADVRFFTLDLRHVSVFDREEEATRWAEDVLRELVKRGPTYKLDVRPFPQET